MATRAKRTAGSFQLNMKRQQHASGASRCQTPVGCGSGVNLTSLILTLESVHLIFLKPSISFRSFFSLSFDNKVSAWISKVSFNPDAEVFMVLHSLCVVVLFTELISTLAQSTFLECENNIHFVFVWF